MTARISLALLVFAVAVLGACASSSGGGQAASNAGAQPAAAQSMAPPADSPLSQIKPGMNDAQVRRLLGDPENANAYVTGKAWIPFYFGTDTTRTDWMYRGQGRVVFSRSQYSGALKVIRVLYNPNETAGM